MSVFPPPPPPPPLLAAASSSRKGLRGWKVAVLAIAVAILAVALSVVAFIPVVRAWRPLLFREPPSVQTSPAPGFPDNWVTIVASDGSFRVNAPGPGTMSQASDGVWAFDLHGWTGASCVLFMDWAGPEPDPSTYTRSRLEAWVSLMRDPHEEPNAVRIGSAVGWRTKMSYEDGSYPVGAFQVLFSNGWEYSMGCGLSFTHPRSADRLTLRFLDSLDTMVRPPAQIPNEDVGVSP